MFTNSIGDRLFRAFIPMIFLRGRKNSEVPRHLRTKKYPFSSTRQDNRNANKYLRQMPNGHFIMQAVDSTFMRQTYTENGVWILPTAFYIEAVTSRRNKNKQGEI